MHDRRKVAADPAAFDHEMARRSLPPVGEAVFAREAERRQAQTSLQEHQTRRNGLSRQVAEGRRSGLDTAALEREAGALRGEMEVLQLRVETIEADIRNTLERLPNILDADVPDGPDESANVVVSQVGQPPKFDFLPRQHFELGEAMGLMDFATAGRLSGSRFTILRGRLAQLERALGQFMLDLHVREHGYEEVSVPALVNSAAMYGTGQLPKFEEDSFRTTDGRWLIPTSEVPLTNTVAGQIVPAARLPLRLAALSECFRSEAGSAGRDTAGMLRQHQFRKVEMVCITHPDESAAEQERMTGCAERVLSALEVPFRRVMLSAGDTGFSAVRTFDLEVWLPGQQAWREISSCSNCRDFQARRMNARFRADDKSVAFVHTLNGSGVAVGRALIAVMENHQQEDGSILIPPALRTLMGNEFLLKGRPAREASHRS